MKAAEVGESAAHPAEQEETTLLEWRIHLMRRSPRRVLVVLLAMAFAGITGYLLFHSALFSLIGVLLIFSATAEFLLPIRYRLTDRRACAHYGAAQLEISWANVRRLLNAEDGIKLSPLDRSSRLDAFRGVLIRFPDSESPICPSQIQETIRQYVTEARRNG